MKILLLFLVFVGFTGIVLPSGYSTEEIFYGTSSIERIPSSIVPERSYPIEIKFRYTDGPYSISDFKPVFDVNPKSASSFVHVEFDSLDGVVRDSVKRIHGTIKVDPEIPNEKIFLSVSYVGTSMYNELISWKSGWNDSTIIAIDSSPNNPCFNEKLRQPMPCNPENSLEFYKFMGEEWMESKKQEMLDAYQSDVFHEWVSQTENHYHWNVYMYYSYTEDLTQFLRHPSPLIQSSHGIEYDKIRCNDDLVLIQKHDDSPACVAYETSFKLIERGWAKIKEHEPISKYPESKSIITINERIPQRTIVPITVTQMTKNVEALDTVTYWGFTILGIEMETLGDYWGNLPPKYDTHIITDENGNEAVDYARVPGGFLTYKLTLWIYPATCEDGSKIKGEGGYPEPIPIKQGMSTVFFNHTGVGLYPNDDGNYSLGFVSGFETDIEFPPDATILSQEIKKCSLDKVKGNFTDVYYTNAKFRFD